MKRYESFYEDGYNEIENEYLTPLEVMNLLAIGRTTFYGLVRSGQLPAFRVGNQWRVSRDALVAFTTPKQ